MLEHLLVTLPLEALQVLDHAVLASELIVVREVVDDLLVIQTESAFRVKEVADGPHGSPVDVPVGAVLLLLLGFGPAPVYEVVYDNRLFKIGLPL